MEIREVAALMLNEVKKVARRYLRMQVQNAYQRDSVQRVTSNVTKR